MSSCAIKAVLYASSALYLVDFATNIAATYDFKNTLDDYSDRADKISNQIVSEEANNFQANSTWFLSVSEEYDSLSTFDKENVYCDVYGIQSDPDSYQASSGNVFGGACFTLGLTVVAHLAGYAGLWKVMRSQEKEKCGIYLKLHNINVKAAIQFAEVGPFLAILVVMIVNHLGVDGYKCQEKFYNCGLSGDCSMDDMMLDVPLNSSLLDVFSSDTILTLSLVVGMFNVMWNFGSGIALWIGEGAGRLLIIPCMQLSVTALPYMWVLWTEGLKTLGRSGDTESIIVIAFTVFITVMFFGSMSAYMYFLAKGSMLVLEKPRKHNISDLENQEKAKKVMNADIQRSKAVSKVSTSVKAHLAFWVIFRCVLATIRFYVCSHVYDWEHVPM